MRYDQMVQNVMDACGLDNAEAVRAIESVVETLGERLSETDHDRLADQLPAELKPHLSKRPTTVPFGLEEFYINPLHSIRC